MKISRYIDSEVSKAYATRIDNNQTSCLRIIENLSHEVDKLLIEVSEYSERLVSQDRKRIGEIIDKLINSVNINLVDKLKYYKDSITTSKED